MGLPAPLSPSQGELHGALRLRLSGGIRRALIKDHDNVTAEVTLNTHRSLRVEKHPITVHRRFESDPLLSHLSQRIQTEYLKPAGICKDRPLPPHEIVKVAVRLDDVSTGP